MKRLSGRGKTPPGVHVHTLAHAERGDKEREREKLLRCRRGGREEGGGATDRGGNEGGNERESGDVDSKIENSRGRWRQERKDEMGEAKVEATLEAPSAVWGRSGRERDGRRKKRQRSGR